MTPACHDAGMSWAAVILTGGTATRLGGLDKASLELADRSLLENALAAVASADEVVVVGPRAPAPGGVRFTREEPPGGGPLAGIAAGVSALTGDHRRVVVLAVDMPHVTAQTVSRLLAASEDVDGAWLTDGDGRRQLAGAVDPALVPSPPAARGAAARMLMTAGTVCDVPALLDEADDVDTWEDVARLSRKTRSGAPRDRT
jgi:molybdopterin-guanine dinucleotide biosynthesis protein A